MCLTRTIVTASILMTAAAAGAIAARPVAHAQQIELGQETTVFRWASDKCDAQDIPDVALRVLDLGKGHAEILSSNSNNRFRQLNTSTLRAVPSCASALKSGRQSDPAAYNDYSWIASLYSDNGSTVHALVHHEYHANDHDGKCQYKIYERCWYNTVTYARSDDGGKTFSQGAPPAVVAAPPFPQEQGQGRRRGFFNPSNIVFHQGFWWALIYTSGWDGQPYGSCLFRTSDINDPGAWRAYDGKDFNARFPDPYTTGAQKQTSVCRPMFEQTVGSVSETSDGKFVAVFIKRERVTERDGQEQFFVAMSWSDDLIHWSGPRKLAPIEDISSKDCSARARYAFPALVSIQDGTIRQDRLEGRVFLSMVRFNVHDCRITLDRDLVFREMAGNLVEPTFTNSK